MTATTDTKDHPEALEHATEAYRAYGATTDHKNYQGLPMPAWADLPETIKRAWCNAAAAVLAFDRPDADAIEQRLTEGVETRERAHDAVARGNATPGCIVFFHEEGGPYPAIVTAAHAEDGSSVDLVTFGRNSVYFQHGIKQAVAPEKGCWTWPQHAKPIGAGAPAEPT